MTYFVAVSFDCNGDFVALVDELDIEDFFVFAHFLGSEAYCK
jgi:hypothetical protein